MKTSSVSSKGQVTIPQEVRVRMDLKEGDRVEFVIENGRKPFFGLLAGARAVLINISGFSPALRAALMA